MSQHAHSNPENLILAALPQPEYERLLPKLEKVPLEFHRTLIEPNQLIENIYFPLTGIVSLLHLLEDGETAEVGMVGYEGMVGLPVFLEAERTTTLALVQVAGEGMKMRADDFREAVNQPGMLQYKLKRYTQALLMQVSQSAACNRFHSVEERFCRWILMNYDRVQGNEFPMTQEFISQMLGVRRPTISIAAGMLQKAELIRYKRGHMTVLDRPGLEEGSCECYRIVRQSFEQLMGGNEAIGESPKRHDGSQ